MNIFFSSDTHWNHSRIIQYCNRPFSCIGEHDESLIQNWNSVVKKTDQIYHLGDIAFGQPEFLRKNILDRLNGKIYLIKGNHDKALKKEIFSSKFEWVKDYFELNIQIPEKKRLVLCHYHFLTWNKKLFGSWHLYGHSHQTENKQEDLSYDVGVDANEYRPVHIDQLIKVMGERILNS